jgi:hypothetical protein
MEFFWSIKDMIFQPEQFWFTINTEEYYGTRLKFDFTGIASEAVYQYLQPLTQMSYCEEIISDLIMIVKDTLSKFGYNASNNSFKNPNLWTLTGPILQPQLPTLLVVSQSMSKAVSPNGFDLKYTGNGEDEISFYTFDSDKLHCTFLSAIEQNESKVLSSRYHSLILINEDLILDVSQCYLPRTLTLDFEYNRNVTASTTVYGINRDKIDLTAFGLFNRIDTPNLSGEQASQLLVHIEEHLLSLGFTLINKKSIKAQKGCFEFEIKYSFPEEVKTVNTHPFYLMKIKPDAYISAFNISVCSILCQELPEFNIFGTKISIDDDDKYKSFLDSDNWGDYNNLKDIILELVNRSEGKIILHEEDKNTLSVLVCSQLEVNRNTILLPAPKFELVIDPHQFNVENILDLSFEGGSDFCAERELINSFAHKKVYLRTYHKDSNFLLGLDSRFHQVIPNYEILLSGLYDLGWEIMSFEGHGKLKVIFGKVSDYTPSDFLPRKTFQELVDLLLTLK